LDYERDMPRQTRPRSNYVTVDEAWKSDIKALMAQRGISQAELARRIRCAPASITLLFKPATDQSRLVPAIHKVLGLDPPSGATISQRDDAKRRLDSIWDSLSTADREVLLTVASRFKRST
jgi:hypothetical protein